MPGARSPSCPPLRARWRSLAAERVAELPQRAGNPLIPWMAVVPRLEDPIGLDLVPPHLPEEGKEVAHAVEIPRVGAERQPVASFGLVELPRSLLRPAEPAVEPLIRPAPPLERLEVLFG